MPAPPHDGLVQGLKQHLTELQSLVHVIGQINRSLEVDDVLQASQTGIQHALGGDFSCFVLIQPDSQSIELALASGLPPALQRELEDLKRDSPLVPPVSQPENHNPIMALGDRLREILKEHATEWAALIPLTARSRPIGVLLVGMGTGRILMPPSVDLLMSIGEQVGMAIENARLHASLRDSEQWHRAFMERSLDGFWEGDFTGRITYANDAVCKIMGYERDELLRMRLSDLQVAPEEDAATGQELRRAGFLKDLLVQGRAKNGEIKILSITSRLIRDAQGNLLSYQSIVRDVGEQQRLLDTLKRRNEELATLNAIGNALSHPFQIPGALHKVCEQLTRMTGMESAAIFLNDESEQKMNLVAYRGIPEELLPQVWQVGLDDPAARGIAVDGNILAMDDLTTFSTASFAGPRAAGYHAGMGIPIKMREKTVGAIFVGSQALYKYEKSDLALLGNIGERVGMALENQNLYAEMQRRLGELDGLARLSAACASSLDPKSISYLAVDWTQRLLGTDMCSLRLLEGDTLRLMAARHTPDTPLAERIPLSSFFSPLVREHKTIPIDNLETDLSVPRDDREKFLAVGLGAVLLVPMLVRDRAIGGLMVGQNKPRHWRRREIDLLKTIANQTANAIDNAQLFQDVLSEKRKVEAIFDSGLSGLYATDADGRIVMFNRAAHRITGWSPNEVKGKHWEEIFADDKILQEPLIYEALRRKRTEFIHEGRKIKTRDGRIIPVAKAVAPLLDEHDQVTGAVGAFWDLTREKAAEISRESFLTMVAHQMRNPLTALISALELVEDAKLSHKRRSEMREVVRSQAERLREFSQHFLDMQKTLVSLPDVKWQALAVGPIVQELVGRCEAEHRTHRFDVQVCEPAPLIFADRTYVDNILCNLLDNAVSYSPEGSRVSVQVCEREDLSMIDVTVRDEGPGISITDQAHIFEAFFRAQQPQGQRAYGHGLGLYIALEMARRIDAKIDVESEEYRGSTFHLILRRSA